ncbi:MAG: carboxy terminal-processing peptidase [Spirochaetes bacterium]|nr:carboxy terminal-processing peptidase [Spirochaetota bacterium]
MYKKRLIPLLTLVIVFSCLKQSQGLKQSDMRMIIGRVLSVHLQYDAIDDNISRRIYSNYMDALDYGRYYFYQSDIRAMSKHELFFDDYIARDDYRAVYEIFALYKNRVNEGMLIFDELIKEDYDFTKDESIVVDRRQVQFARDRADMVDRWRKSIKLQLLNMVSSGKTIKEAKQKLIKKYSITKKRLEEIDDSKLLGIFLNSITTALDPHTNYLDEEEFTDFKISMQLKLQGIGARLRSEDGFTVIESIIPGGAVDKLPEGQKIKANDKIVAVAQDEGEFVDVIDMDLKDVVNLIRGKKGTRVRLSIIRDAGGKTERYIIPIVREEINLEDSDAESHIKIFKRNGKNYKVGYITLPSFYADRERGKSSSGDVEMHLEKLKAEKVDVVILDLRGNGGGLLDEAINIAGLFIQKGPVVQVVSKMYSPRVYSDEDPSIAYDGPLVVLIDNFSASASEILAGAIKDYRRGIIVGGSNTYGKGTVQSMYPLNNETTAIKITINIFYQPGGTSNQLTGIAPDIYVPDITSVWDISEKDNRYPLQWEKISKSDFRQVNRVDNSIVEKLKKLSAARTGSKEYNELKKTIDDYKKKLKNKTLSLKEESDMTRKKDKEIEERYKIDQKKNGIDLSKDLFLREAFNIGCDYSDMLR